MSAEAVIRIACGTVCVAVAAYGSYKFYKFFQNVSRKLHIVQQIQANVEQLHVGDSSLEGDQLRQFMMDLEATKDVLKQVELDFSSVSETDLLNALGLSAKMFVTYGISKE